MRLKKFEWKDNVTELGKVQGLFEIITHNRIVNVSYIIRNYRYWGDPVEDGKFYLVGDTMDIKTCGSIEEAKEMAEDHFRNLIVDWFFDLFED